MISVNMHRIVRVAARYSESGGSHSSHWVEFTFTDDRNDRTEITAFFEDKTYALKVADAVNSSNTLEAVS